MIIFLSLAEKARIVNSFAIRVCVKFLESNV